MIPPEYVLAIDQGTTGTYAVLYNRQGRIAAKAFREIAQIYPQPGWVEHDPMEIWHTVEAVVKELCSHCQTKIAAVGITNQRETTVVWNRKSGIPVCNAIVWQCRRTVAECEKLKLHGALFRKKTGLPVDAYFSGTKLAWILNNYPSLDAEDLLFGTIDTWLIWKLTGGKVHATDYTNASRTLIFNIIEKKWDPELCNLLDIPEALLPEVKSSIDDFGRVNSLPGLKGIPISGVAGDQQAALFGQTCFSSGDAKNTYGTGCFLLLNTGEKAIFSEKGLVTTLAVNGRGHPCYALEGSIFIGGAAIQWLRDELGLLEKSSDSEAAALAVEDNAGVYLVPAFVGLGAPYWNMDARGIITGLTRGANRNHIIRASLEAMVYQTYDVLKAMEEESGFCIKNLAVDGGAAANDSKNIESTSLGVAYMAGLKTGFWKDSKELEGIRSIEKEFNPAMAEDTRNSLLAGWRKALRQALIKM
jgi:glycerol kinase